MTDSTSHRSVVVLAVLALLGALGAPGCSCGGGIDLGTDSRLGVKVWEKAAQGAKQPQPGNTFLGLGLFLDNAIQLKTGNTHVFVGYRPWRELGSPDETWGEAQHFVVDAQGKVSELPAPPVSYPLWESASALRTIDTDQPGLLLQGHRGGEAFRLLVFDLQKKSWVTRPFFWSDRPSGAKQPTLNAANGQLRAFSADEVLVQFENKLTLLRGTTWQPLDGPPGENSPFAAAFLRQLNAQSVDLQAMGTLLRRDLLIATECRQMLWEQNTYAAPFVFKGIGKAAPRPEPAGIVELPKLYEYARQNKLPVPAGLVALRPGNSHDGKIGTYSFDSQSMGFVRPAYIAILSASNDVAHTILGVYAADDHQVKKFTFRWRLAPLPLSERAVILDSVDGISRTEFSWRGANPVSYTLMPLRANFSPFSSKLVRLDG